ncbi:hypothetical protein [Robiginitalea sp. IMCC43444]|uniref:hypothetical protein n=1 Tax=Robiginitalea sp. IMCC43444 TaxID=3459121 RepID=UPI004041EE00
MAKPIADLHCHPSLKPANNKNISGLWPGVRNITTGRLFNGLRLGSLLRKWAIGLFLKNTAKYTQSNLDACYKGNNRLLCLALYPPERPFLRPDRPFDNATTAQRLLLRSLFANLGVDRKIIQALTGFSKTQTLAYLDSVYKQEQVDYFKDLIREYSTVLQAHESQSSLPEFHQAPAFRLIRDARELEGLGQNEIAGILSIEGMHALGVYPREALFVAETLEDLRETEQVAVKQAFINNIARLKDENQMPFTPFFITLSHHFNNLLAGHAKSFADAPNRTVPGFSDVFNQSNGLDRGISSFGQKLIREELLSRHNGRRILIDTKHMSMRARDDYAEMVRTYWMDEGDRVPIICSHAAINGIPSREAAGNYSNINRNNPDAYVSRWDINLTDQDIREVFDSDGIIGLCLHDGRMPGGRFKKLLQVESRAMGSSEEIRRMHTQIFLSNVFHVVRINLEHLRSQNLEGAQIPESECWKTICLGSDYDGIVDPFDHFDTAADFKDFRHYCREGIRYNFSPLEVRKKRRVLKIDERRARPYTPEEFAELLMGHTPEEIVDAIFSDNLMNFLKKYYREGYLKA